MLKKHRLAWVALCVLTVAAGLCGCSGASPKRSASSPRTTRSTTRRRTRQKKTNYYIRSITLSRLKGMRNRHFASQIRYQSNYIRTPYYGATGLPPGLKLNRSSGLISGTPPKSGIWHVTIFVGDRYKGTPTDPRPNRARTMSFEIRIYDRLTD